MKSITPHSVINNIPTIKISHKGLLAIQRIVSLAPEEVQWFHTVEATSDGSSFNETTLRLSEELYIPTQNTSATEVSTTSSMMVEFYNDLKEHRTQKEVNEVLSKLTCWCHSHHRMSPSSSGQDETQFETLIQQSIDQNMNNFQIMLIFNKKNQFYCKVYDPRTGCIHEGVPIALDEDGYDLSYIDLAAKTKLKKQRPIFKKEKGKKGFSGWKNWSTKNEKQSSPASWKGNQRYDSNESFFFEKETARGYSSFLPEQVTLVNEQLLTDIMNSVCELPFDLTDKNGPEEEISFLEEENVRLFMNALGVVFDDRELLFFTKHYAEKEHEILDIFSVRAFNKLGLDLCDLEDELFETLSGTSISNKKLYEDLKKTLEISDLGTKKEYKEYLKSI
jgi:hypothetical protein